LLRADRNRQSSGRAAEHRNEITPPHLRPHRLVWRTLIALKSRSSYQIW
jgi:hypothetical protein